MFDPSTLTTQQSQVQYAQQQQTQVVTASGGGGQQQQQQQAADAKDVKILQVQTAQQSNAPPPDGSKQQQQQQTFSGFCYANVNMIHKIEPGDVAQHNSTVNMSQLADDKCYITQPFSYNYALVNQMSLAQTNIGNISFKCDVCGLMFTHISLLNHHKRTHQQEATVATSTPQQITIQVQQQQQQQQQQIQIVAAAADRIRYDVAPSGGDAGNQQRFSVRYSCDDCGVSFLTQPDLKTHRQQQHPSSAKVKNCETCGAPLPPDSNKKRAVMKVKCETCLSAEVIQSQPSQIFVVPTGATDGATATVKEEATATPQIGTQNTIPIGQVKHHHPVKRRGVASVTKCTKCNGSGIIFIGGAKNQASNVEKPFHCNICNGSFSRYSSLWSHKRLHTGEKNFKCNICGLAFAKAAYLKNHSRIHTGEKPYRCNVCGMQFSQSPHLKNHERIHSGERPYVCEVCDKSFARHSTLWNHRRIHTGEKPYRCDICGSCFNQATHLKNHAKVHSGEKPFKCDICSVGFSDRFALKRHRNIHEKYGRTKPVTGGVGGGGGGSVSTGGSTAAGSGEQAGTSMVDGEHPDTTNTEVMIVEPKFETDDMPEIGDMQVQLA